MVINMKYVVFDTRYDFEKYVCNNITYLGEYVKVDDKLKNFLINNYNYNNFDNSDNSDCEIHYIDELFIIFECNNIVVEPSLRYDLNIHFTFIAKESFYDI